VRQQALIRPMCGHASGRTPGAMASKRHEGGLRSTSEQHTGQAHVRALQETSGRERIAGTRVVAMATF
ncbi:MAG: hypothetical protein ACTHOH_18215, partial [Lysobacteraceae bacterium]